MSNQPGVKSPFPSRREIREKAQEEELKTQLKHAQNPPAQSSGRIGATLLKAGLLSALSLTTIVVPSMGFVGPENTITVPPKAVVSMGSLQSWVTVNPPAAEDATYLRKVSSAASRARVRTPLEIRSCSPKPTTANGDRPVEQISVTNWPVRKDSVLTASAFGPRFMPGVGYNMHTGLDMAGPVGTPIYAVADGEVVESGPSSVGYGYLVVIQHTDESGKAYQSAYAHMYPNQVLVKKGDQVKAAQQIAGIGSNGWSTGPHLHFEIRDGNGGFEDPAAWLEKVKATQPGEGC